MVRCRSDLPIFDSSWVSHALVVPKKGGTIVIINEKNELLQTRIVTGWRIRSPLLRKIRRRPPSHALWRMPFWLCKAPGTFQRCMMAIFTISSKNPLKSSWMISW